MGQRTCNIWQLFVDIFSHFYSTVVSITVSVTEMLRNKELLVFALMIYKVLKSYYITILENDTVLMYMLTTVNKIVSK